MKVTQWCPTFLPPHSPGQNTGVSSLSILQGIFPTQGLNPGLPHFRWILYQLSHKRSLRILEWVAYPFSRCIFPTQESIRGLLHCKQILYQLSYQRSPVQLFATLWTIPTRLLYPWGFSRQEYWSGLPFPFPLQEKANILHYNSMLLTVCELIVGLP